MYCNLTALIFQTLFVHCMYQQFDYALEEVTFFQLRKHLIVILTIMSSHN